MSECKPLLWSLAAGEPHAALRGRGLHSLTSQLNLSVFYEIGGARRGS
jgi:hypothetical protein